MAETPHRNELPRRADYRPGSPSESFIVPLLKDRIEQAIRGLDPRPRKCLDVGCGRQPFRNILEASDCRYVGIDVIQSPEDSVDFIAAIDAPLPPELLATGPFDFVLCTEVLEHVADWSAAFASFAALTMPGGRVLITCPHFYKLHEEPYDFWRPTLHAIAHFACIHGLKVVHQEAVGDGWDVLGTLLASCVASPHQPAILPRIAAKMVHLAQWFYIWLLMRRLPQRMARLSGVYLSNVVLLEKL